MLRFIMMRLPPVLSSAEIGPVREVGSCYGFNVNARRVEWEGTGKNDEQPAMVNGFPSQQSRILPMSLRLFALAALVLFGAFAVVGCGVRDEGETVTENVLTAELVVPPASQVTVEPPTATVAPTATTEEVAGESGEEEEPARVNVPNRGYNSYGNPDAPITMFDFSDFL